MPQPLFVICLFSIPVILMHLAQAARFQWPALRLGISDRTRTWGEALAYASMLWLIIVNSGTPGEFIYFQF